MNFSSHQHFSINKLKELHHYFHLTVFNAMLIFTHISVCDPPCMHNGACVAGTCLCPPGYSGKVCQDLGKLNPLEPLPQGCGQGSVCSACNSAVILVMDWLTKGNGSMHVTGHWVYNHLVYVSHFILQHNQALGNWD